MSSVMSFNSIKVRLELSAASASLAAANYSFNSIKVRLERLCILQHSRLPRFNSIKVRLERCGCAMPPAVPVFQFHKGTIRTSLPPIQTNAYSRFNSIKVRLEQSNGYRHKPGYNKFQFHKGTIRTTYNHHTNINLQVSIP